MKKTIALLLAAVMVMSLFTGCGSEKTEEKAEAKPAEAVTVAEHEGTSAEEEKNPGLSAGAESLETVSSEHWLCEEKTTLRISTYDAVNNTYPPPSNDQWFWQALEDYTNVHVEWEVSPLAGYDDVVSTRVSAGVDLADIMMSNSTRATKNAGKSGVFLDLMPYWDSCFTNTQAYFDSMNVDLLSLIKNPNGAVYGIPNTQNPTEGHITIMYNTSWMESLGAEVPTTLDEFTALLYQMQEAGDLNENGLKDEIVLTSSGIDMLVSGIGTAFNLEQYEGWDAFDADANGKVFDEYTTDNMRACVKYMNELYNAGVLDSEIPYMTMDALGEKIANDRVGVFVFYSGFAIGYGLLTTEGIENPLKEVYTLGMPLASEWNGNEGYFVRRTVAYGNSGASITSACENPELAAKWLDTLYADPNIMWIRCYGKEGETFRYDENGEVELIVGESGEWDPSYLGIGQITLPFIQTTEELLSDKLPYDWYLEEYEQMRNCKWINASVPKVSIFSDEESNLRDEVNSEVLNYWYEYRDRFVTGLSDIDAEWDSYVDSMYMIGLDQLVESWQMVYDRLG